MGRGFKKFDNDAAKKIELEVAARAYVEGGCTYSGLKEVLLQTQFRLAKPHELVRNGYFQAMVRQVLTEKFEHLELSPQRVLQETAAIAYVKISDVFDERGDLIEPYMLPAHIAAAISSLEIEARTDINPTGKRRAKHTIDVEAIANGDTEDDQVDISRTITKKYKFHDKNTALALLARHYKIVGGQDEGINALASALADRLKAARTRLPNNASQAIEEATIIEHPQQESDHEIW